MKIQDPVANIRGLLVGSYDDPTANIGNLNYLYDTVFSFQNNCNHLKQDKIIKNDNQIV